MCAALLARADIEVNAKCTNGYTALHLAAKLGHPWIDNDCTLVDPFWTLFACGLAFACLEVWAKLGSVPLLDRH